jgi:hypothetical protein
MHRVVTKAMRTHSGIRKREIDQGPWQPSEALARRWAQYLESTGRYDSVTVESNGQPDPSDASGMDAPEDDLFLEIGN